MQKALFIVNLIACLIFALYLLEPVKTRLAVAGRYSTLDRANVINHDALKTFDPILADNDRYRVSMWLCESAFAAQRRSAAIGFVLATLNLSIWCIFCSKIKKEDRNRLAAVDK